MGDKLKTAYELAMERLAKTSGSRAAAPRKLSDGQKARIAAIRQEYEAKLAERQILYQAARRESQDPEEWAKLDDSYRRDREHLESQREIKLSGARGEEES